MAGADRRPWDMSLFPLPLIEYELTGRSTSSSHLQGSLRLLTGAVHLLQFINLNDSAVLYAEMSISTINRGLLLFPNVIELRAFPKAFER
jgi:hypothetical protein